MGMVNYIDCISGVNVVHNRCDCWKSENERQYQNEYKRH